MSEPDLYESGRYRELNPTWHEEDAEHKATALHAFCRWLALEPRTVVDVGCGTGWMLKAFKELRDADGYLDCRYEGWDIAKDAVRSARLLESDRLRFVADDFLASERRADLILCIDTFEHVADDVGFLARLRDRAPFFLFRIPLDLSALDGLRPGRMLEARRRWGHLHAYNRELALQVLRDAGYRIGAERYDRVPPELERTRQRVMDGVRRTAFRVAPHLTVRALGGWSLLVFAAPRTNPGR